MQRIHVVAAVIERGDSILIARRPDHVHQGGKWEFPGGKLEAGEPPAAGLRRELQEELGIEVQVAQPLIRIAHDYPDKAVLLDVWRVSEFGGEPHGREGQQVQWVRRQALNDFSFPAANVPIIAAAQLPSTYVISPELESVSDFLQQLTATLACGHRLVQIRTRTINAGDWESLLAGLRDLKQRFAAVFLLNSAIGFAHSGEFEGLHLTANDLRNLQKRPAGYRWVAASCHSPEEILLAETRGVDFITLSPVKPTQSHPGADALGIDLFTRWVEKARVPVFGLGGLTIQDLPQLTACGAQGVAAIRGLWQLQD